MSEFHNLIINMSFCSKEEDRFSQIFYDFVFHLRINQLEDSISTVQTQSHRKMKI